jgi:hypothetical protein
MAFTNGSLYGKLEGQAVSGNNNPFNACNTTNPNQQPAKDVFQILAPGGACLLQVTAAGVVNTNVAAGSFTPDVVVAKVQMVITAYNSLPASPTAAQICAAAFPQNYNNQKLDLIQYESDIATINVQGGGFVVWRLLYNGSTATS